MTRGPRFQVYQAGDGFRWRLIGGNGKIMATGEAHPRRADAVRAARGVAARAARAYIAGAATGWRGV